MKISLVAVLALAVAGTSFARQDPPDMGKEMEKAKKWMTPGKNHELLKKFLGSWTTETKMYFGDKASPPAKGTAEGQWLIEGRWVRIDTKGELMGMSMHSVSILGYDNFKKSYVCTKVSNFDTAMIRVEGDLDQSGQSLLAYGTLDEYLTGEHDKAIKVAWRFESDDKIVMEVHDFAIGETNTKVFDVTYMRKK